MLTAIKTDKFSIAVNFRNSALKGVDESSYLALRTIRGFASNAGMVLCGAWTVTSLMRHIMETADDYDTAVAMARSKWASGRRT